MRVTWLNIGSTIELGDHTLKLVESTSRRVKVGVIPKLPGWDKTDGCLDLRPVLAPPETPSPTGIAG